MRSKKPPTRENISSRPTDSSGRRASNADLGLDAAAAAAARSRAAEKILAREGTTNPRGGRAPAVLRTTKGAPPIKPIRLPANPNKPAVRQNAIIRTTTNMKPTPAKKK
jgi:hypothetical protein